MSDKLTIGSRASKLALAQTHWVADELRRFHEGLEVEIIEVKTTGDIKAGASLSEIGGKGAFTKELEDALLDGRCELAVHSLKDLPTVLPEGLRLGCTPVRESTHDVVLVKDGLAGAKAQPLGYLPTGAIVGTSSPRRRAMLLRHRPDLEVVEFRGNIDTRLGKLAKGVADACVLAAAGLKRLALLDEVEMRVNGLKAHALEPPEWLPAPGQGALGVEVRADDARAIHLLAPLHDAATYAATAAERAFLRRLGAGCMAPVGALAVAPEGSSLKLQGWVLSRDGKTRVQHEAAGSIDQPEQLGEQVAAWCMANGADGLV